MRKKKLSHSVSPPQWVRRIDVTTTQSLCARRTTAACPSGPSVMARTTAGTTAMSRAAVSLLFFKDDRDLNLTSKQDKQVSLHNEILSSLFTLELNRIKNVLIDGADNEFLSLEILNKNILHLLPVWASLSFRQNENKHKNKIINTEVMFKVWVKGNWPALYPPWEHYTAA